jgi:hypothetical protein
MEATERSVSGVPTVWIDFRRNLPNFLIALGVRALGWLAFRVTEPRAEKRREARLSSGSPKPQLNRGRSLAPWPSVANALA